MRASKTDSAPGTREPAGEEHHDVVAIGGGPFNLGLCALASRIEGLDLLALEAQSELRWHPGLMFDDALLQLSFLADLVTLIDPSHPLSFLAYLRDVDRMYPFFIREDFHPTRREYEDYLRWAARKLPTLRFGHCVTSLRWLPARERFALDVTRANGELLRVWAKDVVIGIGTEPALPEALELLPEREVFHSALYLQRRSELLERPHVTVVGSGQSAAEIVLDLLRENLAGGPALSWITRSSSFAPLDDSKLVLEMTTPEYVQYFHGLPEATRDRLNAEQWQHYKGISTRTLAQIHHLLYQRELSAGLEPVQLCCGLGVEGAASERAGEVTLAVRHRDTGRLFEHRTSLVIAATGYRERRPAFLEPLEPLVERDGKGRYRVRRDYSIELDERVTGRIFVVNAELHTHGVATPDLGISAYRNATILNAITGREAYRLPRHTAYTTFAAPPAPAASTEGRPPNLVQEARSAVRSPGGQDAYDQLGS